MLRFPDTALASVAPWGQCCVLASWYRGQDCRTCSEVCGPVPYMQSSVCDSFRRYRWALRSRQWSERSLAMVVCWWRWRCCIWSSDVTTILAFVPEFTLQGLMHNIYIYILLKNSTLFPMCVYIYLYVSSLYRRRCEIESIQRSLLYAPRSPVPARRLSAWGKGVMNWHFSFCSLLHNLHCQGRVGRGLVGVNNTAWVMAEELSTVFACAFVNFDMLWFIQSFFYSFVRSPIHSIICMCSWST